MNQDERQRAFAAAKLARLFGESQARSGEYGPSREDLHER